MRAILLVFMAAALCRAQPNVLLICVDDLRPELGCAGAAHAITPNLDALAGSGRLFTRHYVAVPTCGASRAALITGVRPSHRSHLGNGAVKATNERMSLPRAFKQRGYVTATLGKVTHWPVDPPHAPDELQDAWTRVLRFDSTPWGDNKDAFFAYADGSVRERGVSPIAESPDVGDDAYPDARIADAAIEALDELRDDQPFLLAIGFFKPHLPFNAPKRYWDLYDRGAIPDAPRPTRPEDLPEVHGWRQSGEVTGNYGHDMWADRGWDADERAFMRHAYLACVSYVDAQIGRVLEALDEQGLGENTIVVVWGDHGWHLGDEGLMGKHTTFEAALRSPLIIRAPGMDRAGEPSDALVSTLDVFPTLAALCDVPAPDGLSGVSIAGIVLHDPSASVRREVTSWWRVGEHVGESVRTIDRRIVRWRAGFNGDVVSTERHERP